MSLFPGEVALVKTSMGVGSIFNGSSQKPHTFSGEKTQFCCKVLAQDRLWQWHYRYGFLPHLKSWQVLVSTL
jgi:hypothetical protein